MKRIGIKAQVGYRSPRARKGEVSIVSPDRLQRQFNPDAPDERWVTDITYIRTHEGWLYLAVVVDLFSRKIISWSMQSRMTKDIVLNALLMAVWRGQSNDGSEVSKLSVAIQPGLWKQLNKRQGRTGAHKM